MRLPATHFFLLVCIDGVLGALRSAAPRCIESLLPIHATATNFDLRGADGNLPAPPLNKPFTVSGTFLVQATFCEPTVRNASRANTLLIMAPGGTYDSVYWDIQFQAERYSFVRFAAGHGFSTLNLARLESLGLLPARQVVPARFRGLASGFLTSHNETNRAVFYGPPGTFDPRVLAYDEATKDLVSTGELGTLNVPVLTAVSAFRGDVLIINGANDQLFCDSTACDNLAGEPQFYPKARTMETVVIQNSGHSLNFHLVAPTFFATVLDWLTRHGF